MIHIKPPLLALTIFTGAAMACAGHPECPNVPSQIYISGLSRNILPRGSFFTESFDNWLLIRTQSDELLEKALAVKSAAEMNEFCKANGFEDHRLVKDRKTVDVLREFSIDEPDADGVAVLAASEIIVQSPEECWVCCLVGCDDVLDVAINGSPITTISKRQDISGPGVVVRFKLSPGSNLLSLALRNKSGLMGFTMRPQENFDVATHNVLASAVSYVGSLAIADRDKYKYESQVRINAAGISFSLGVEDLEGRQVWSGNVDDFETAVKEKPGIPDGIYSVKTRMGGRFLRNTICIGDPAGIAEQIRGELKGFDKTPISVAHNIDGFFRRIDILLKEENRKQSDYNWQAKVVNYLESLKLISNALRASNKMD